MKKIRVEIVGLFVGAVIALTLVAAAEAAGAQHGGRHKYSFALQRANGSSTVVGSWDSSKPPKASGDQILVVRDGRTYKITDKQIFKQALEIFAPMEKLGAEQGALGDRQGKLGGEQAGLGDKQAALGDELGRASEGLSGSAGDAQKTLEARIEKVSKELKSLGKLQEALARRQEDLGREQEVLGKRQEEAARVAEGKFNKLLDAAFAKGLAKPL